MGLGSGSCEIIEVEEAPRRPPKGKVYESYSTFAMNHGVEKRTVLQGRSCDSVEDDINLLFDSIHLKVSRNIMGQSRDDGFNSLKKSAMKKPIRMGVSYSPGSEISEQVSLKQALRGLCISQASEMAAIKRLSKSVASSPRISEAGRIKSLFKAKVVEAGESSKSKGYTDSIGESVSSKCQRSPHFHQEITTQSTKKSFVSSPRIIMNDIRKQTGKSPSPDKTYPLSPAFGKQTLKEEITETSEEGNDVKFPTSIKITKKESSAKTELQSKSQKFLLPSGSITGKRLNKLNRKPQIVVKSVLKNKIASKKKLTHDSSSSAKSHLKSDANDVSNCQLVCQRCQCTLQLDGTTQSPEYFDVEVDSNDAPSRSLDEASKQGLSLTDSMKDNAVKVVANKNAKSGEKCEFSNSSKSSVGEFSSATSISDDSNPSRLSCSNRPHMARDVRWLAIHHIKRQSGALSLENFNLLKKLGCGDIGTVYSAELIGTNCPFAIKVMDIEYLARRKKLPRAQAEREILRMLDHPFLPTLYAQFTSDNLSCLVMEYCPGGDLHVLRQKQPGRCFPEQSARFYVAEVLLALEYLHMLGVVYRDLKPENILVREDGHIMLTDFDLSLRCDVNPVILQSSDSIEPSRISGLCRGKSCIDPFCIDPTCKVSCFSPRVHSKARNRKPDPAVQARSLLQLVAEPTEARSNSFVGTHEYLAPEIIKGEGHGSAVDWWTLGVFLYELLYGKTPFKGAGNDETLMNVVLQCLKFPDTPLVSFQARDLIKSLLVKEPDNRLGSERGAAEIKHHPFFEGLNWALIRCAPPPELPELYDHHYQVSDPASERKSNYLQYNVSGEQLEFEFF